MNFSPKSNEEIFEFPHLEEEKQRGLIKILSFDVGEGIWKFRPGFSSSDFPPRLFNFNPIERDSIISIRIISRVYNE